MKGRMGSDLFMIKGTYNMFVSRFSTLALLNTYHWEVQKMEKTLYDGESNNWCAYCTLHRCAMTFKQMRRKECLLKQCKYLVKREGHRIWRQREQVKAKRKARKAMLAAI